MKRNGLARLMAAMVAVALACGVLASCDDDDDDDGPSVVQQLVAVDDGETFLTVKFYDNGTWRAWEDEEGMRGTYTGTAAATGSVTVTATKYRNEDGNWADPPVGVGTCAVTSSDGTVTNIDDVMHWIESFYDDEGDE